MRLISRIIPDRVRQAEMFAALRYRNFRYFWVATLISSIGRWGEMVVLGWLAIVLTGSPFLCAVAVASRWVGYVLGPFCGVIADRYDRRKLTIALAGFSAVYSAALAILIATGVLEFWHLVVMGLISGVAHALHGPVRMAFIGEIVGRDTITNALGMSAIAMDLTAIAGPAAAGMLIPIIGEDGICWVMVAAHILDMGAYSLIRTKSELEKAKKESVWGSLIEGFRYIRGNHPVFALLIIALMYQFFVFPVQYALLPVFANLVWDVGASGYGFLNSATGVGAMVAAFIIISLGKFRYKTWLCIIASILVGVLGAAFSLSNSFPVSLVLFGGFGMMKSLGLTMTTVSYLFFTPDEMRGRVQGVRGLVIIALTLSNIMVGAIAERFGCPAAGAIIGALQVVAILAIAMVVPSLRTAEREEDLADTGRKHI